MKSEEALKKLLNKIVTKTYKKKILYNINMGVKNIVEM